MTSFQESKTSSYAKCIALRLCDQAECRAMHVGRDTSVMQHNKMGDVNGLPVMFIYRCEIAFFFESDGKPKYTHSLVTAYKMSVPHFKIVFVPSWNSKVGHTILKWGTLIMQRHSYV